MRGAPALHALLFDGIESPQTGIPGGREDHVSAFPDLCQREFSTFARIVPRRICHANIVSDHAYVWVDGLSAFLVTLRETMDQSDVHSAQKSDRARPRSLRSEYADEVRTFMLLED